MSKGKIKLSVPVTEQLDQCGDEFLDEREFYIDFEVLDTDWIRCTIDGRPNIFIEKSAILTLATLIREFKEV